MSLEKTKVYLDLYDEMTQGSNYGDDVELVREGIEDQIETQDYQELRRSQEGQQLLPRIGKMLKGEKKRDLDEKRAGAKGVRG